MAVFESGGIINAIFYDGHVMGTSGLGGGGVTVWGAFLVIVR